MADPPETGEPEGPSLELPSLRSALRRGRRRSPEPVVGDVPAAGPVATVEKPAEEPPSVPRRRRVRRPRALHVPGRVAAPVVGALAGLVLVGLTGVGLRACTALRGTPSCGEPGLLLLLAATALTVLLGSLLLRVAGVDTHASTSLLGVGLLVVVVLVALLPWVDRWWMVVVVPAVSTVTYLAAWWVTTTHVEPGERAR